MKSKKCKDERSSGLQTICLALDKDSLDMLNVRIKLGEMYEDRG